MELEGLRGIAALSVVIHHFVFAYFPYLLEGGNTVRHSRFEDNIYGTPLALIYAGTFAVAVFFVLSGFVLSIGYFQTKNEMIIKKLASKRYLRLMLPALAATMLCFVLLSLGAPKLITATAAITQSEWLAGTWSMDSSIFGALYSGAIGIFLQSGSAYDNVLWTMMIEFFGSFLVFGFLLLFAKSKYRWIMYLALAVVTFNSWFLPFIIGMALADAYAQGWLSKLANRTSLIVTLVVGGLILGSFPHGKVTGTAYQLIDLQALHIGVKTEMLYLTVGATMILLAVLVSSRLKQWFSAGWVSNLGKYTFSLYLTHLAILYTVTSAAFLLFNQSVGYTTAALLGLAVSLPVIWLVTRLFERYVDAPSIRFAKYAAELYDGKRQLPDLGKAVWAREIEAYRAAHSVWYSRTVDLLAVND